MGGAASGAHGGSRLKSVLLVESDGPKAAGFLRALEQTGLSVVAIPEGERALDRARTQRPDLVVAASTLRDMSGFSLCNRLRRVPSLADMPIVLVSVEGDAAAVETHRGGRTPATRYLPPEALPKDLVECVQDVLGLDGRNSDTPAEELLELEALPEELPPEDNERTGLSVITMPEGERALDRARSQRPDLVVAASALRDMSGFSLCNRLRRVPGLADLPIVLVSGAGDADAVATHRGSKTPATEYLPPDAPPNDLVRCVTDVLGLAAMNGDEGGIEEPMELEALLEDASAEPERTVLQSRPSLPPVAPPLPQSMPPPLPSATGGPPPLARKTARADPFADLPAEPRLAMGASPDEKVQFFRERLKAKEDLLSRVRDGYQALRNDLEGAERDLATARKDLDERQRARDQAEQALTELRTEHARVSKDLDAAQTELSLGAHETATLRQDAEERAQSLSQLLNETMQEREEENKQWSAKLADGERRLALLQEEVDHLASELEARGQELATVQGGAGDLQAAMEEVRQRAQEDSAVLGEKLEQLQQENAALSSDLSAQRAALEIKEADLAAEIARSQATSNAVAEAEETAQAMRDEWQAERQSWEEKQREAQAIQESLEQRIAEADARQAELRGELEAVQEVEQQGAGAESRLVELEAELSSRVDEVNGLRSELETLAQERAQQEADSAARLADLSAQLDAKEGQLQETISAHSDQEARASQHQAKAAEALDEAQRTEARAHSAEVELSRAEGRARAAEAEAAEAEGRARDAAERIAHLEASLQDAEARAEAAQSALAKAAQPPPSSGSNPPGGGDKSLRVRISDLTLELQTLRTKLAQAQGSGLSAEVARLRDEVEAQRAENDFLTGELDRLQGGNL